MAWADTKRSIARIIGPRLAALGFVNPGRAMWRFRPAFVDVVWFECRRSWRFQLEFACGLRGQLPNNPAPWDCPFRVSPAHAFGWPDEWWALRGSEAERAAVEAMAPQVTEAAETWFGQLASVEAAIQALAANEWGTPREVAMCRPGSPAWHRTMAELRAVVAPDAEPGAAADSRGQSGFPE